jgi:hypothetical protein
LLQSERSCDSRLQIHRDGERQCGRARRETYRREEARFPSESRDAEWVRLEPLIPGATPGGRARKTDMRAALNAILYLLRTGCPWR